MRWLGFVVVVLGLVLGTRTAHAETEEPPRYRIELSVGPGAQSCDRPDVFEALLDELIVQPLLDPPASQRLVVRIERARNGRFAVTLRIVDEAGAVSKELHPSYRASMEGFEVLYHAAFEAAVMLEPYPPLHLSRPCPTSPACSLRPIAFPISAPRVPAKYVIVKGPPDPMRFEAHLGGLYMGGATLEPTLGAQLGAGLSWPGRFSIELDGRVTLPVEGAPLGKTVLRMWTAQGAVVPCWRTGLLGLCGVGMVGGLWQRAVNQGWSATGSAPFVGLGGRVMLDWPVGDRFALRVGAELVGAAVRGQVKVKETVLWSTRPVIGDGSIAWVVRF